MTGPCLLVLALCGAPPHLPLQVRLPELTALAEAESRRDAVEVERLARRLGAARLMKAVETAPPRLRGAALAALPLVDDAWSALPRLAQLAGGRDVGLAVGAARAAGEIGARLERETLAETELPPDVPRAAQRSLLDVARDPTLPGEQRGAALEAAAGFARLLPLAEATLAPLLRDGAPPVRRAAAQALEPARATALLLELLGDADPLIALGAAEVICAAPPASGRRARAAKADTPALDEPARDRLRGLAADEKLGAARAPLAACLRSFGTARDRALLKQIADIPSKKSKDAGSKQTTKSKSESKANRSVESQKARKP